MIRRSLDAFNKGDVETVFELWTTDAEWRPAFLGGGLVEGAVYRGREGIAEFFEMQAETWESALVDPVEIRDHGDRVLMEVHVVAVGRASGIRVDQVAWAMFEMREGKVAAGRVYTSEEEALKAMGARDN